MRFLKRAQSILIAAVFVLALFLGQGACDSTCPNVITNITARSGSLSFPESGDYGINVTKCWKIEVPEPYSGFVYTYKRFEIERCKDCECDSIKFTPFYNSLNSGGDRKCGRYSTSWLDQPEAGHGFSAPRGGFGSSRTYIRFVSDDTVHHAGFSFNFIAISDDGGEKNHLNASDGETIVFGTPKVGIQNYKYPKNYKENWFLYGGEGTQIQIDFDIFDLEQSENCKNDYLEFREEDNGGEFLAGPLCGNGKPNSIQSKGNRVWVHFRSDSNETTVYKGFKASFKTVGGHAGKLSVSSPLALLIASALLMIASKESVF